MQTMNLKSCNITRSHAKSKFRSLVSPLQISDTQMYFDTNTCNKTVFSCFILGLHSTEHFMCLIDASISNNILPFISDGNRGSFLQYNSAGQTMCHRLHIVSNDVHYKTYHIYSTNRIW